MTLRPFPMLIAMLLMLTVGVGLGMLITTSHRSTVNAAVETSSAAVLPAPSGAWQKYSYRQRHGII